MVPPAAVTKVLRRCRTAASADDDCASDAATLGRHSCDGWLCTDLNLVVVGFRTDILHVEMCGQIHAVGCLVEGSVECR